MTIDPQLELAIGQIVDLADKISAVSAAVLTLSITFLKEVVRTPDKKDRNLITAAWIGFLLTIVAGIMTRMAITGSLLKTIPLVKIEENVSRPATVQIGLFMVSTILFILLGRRGLVERGKTERPTQA